MIRFQISNIVTKFMWLIHIVGPFTVSQGPSLCCKLLDQSSVWLSTVNVRGCMMGHVRCPSLCVSESFFPKRLSAQSLKFVMSIYMSLLIIFYRTSQLFCLQLQRMKEKLRKFVDLISWLSNLFFPARFSTHFFQFVDVYIM